MRRVAAAHERSLRQSATLKPLTYNGLSGAVGVSGTVSVCQRPTPTVGAQAAAYPLLSKKKNSAHTAQSTRNPRHRKRLPLSGTKSAVRANERTADFSHSRLGHRQLHKLVARQTTDPNFPDHHRSIK